MPKFTEEERNRVAALLENAEDYLRALCLHIYYTCTRGESDEAQEWVNDTRNRLLENLSTLED